MADATDNVAKDSSGPRKDTDSPRPLAKAAPNPAMLFFQGLASLRLTVVLLFLGSLLVFFGTLAQVDQGIWQIMSKYFRSFIVLIPLDIFTVFSSRHGIDEPIAGLFPFPGGWTIGFLLLANLLAAHALRFRLRVGILTLHAGLVILLLSEFITGVFAIEMRMDITEGSSSNYAYDIREAELIVVDTSGEEEDRVVAIPQSKLIEGQVIQHEALPFDIEVLSFFENSKLEKITPPKQSEATFGTGLFYEAVDQPVAAGTGTDQQVDSPAAYFTLRQKGTDSTIGTCMTSCAFNVPFRDDWETIPQRQIVDGKPYEVHLRYRRYYKPYSLYLQDFSFDKYPGTETARNFSSMVHLTDPARGVDREVLIWMNHPLRYQGETFFQSSFKPDETGTVLQVVRNPGWLMPYISCTMISLGLIIHFTQTLSKFLRRELAK